MIVADNAKDKSPTGTAYETLTMTVHALDLFDNALDSLAEALSNSKKVTPESIRLTSLPSCIWLISLN